MPDMQSPDAIRSLFSSAMSQMYKGEVPQYGALLDLVRDVNEAALASDPAFRAELESANELHRLGLERHGAIRLGTPGELAIMGRMFALMGMYPVGYYDLSVAGIPVHSTAFRPVDEPSLQKNPFRVFTSLLRLELIDDRVLAAKAQKILSTRQIVSDGALALIAKGERQGGLSEPDAARFVVEALETFRWHSDAIVDAQTYAQLHNAHPLVADVVSFRGPHINHLTPRSLDIDAAQAQMRRRGITPKAVIEGPPRRKAPILLRQTSFKALEEEVRFSGTPGRHTARFGEIEQRGVALTPKGREHYDAALNTALATAQENQSRDGAPGYEDILRSAFSDFPDSYDSLRKENLAYFKYRAGAPVGGRATSLEELISRGCLVPEPQTYEDFLPVSAAGIFRSNLASSDGAAHGAAGDQRTFETALGRTVIDPHALYRASERDSLSTALRDLDQDASLVDEVSSR